MCEICTHLKIEEFINELEWDLFDLDLTRLIFKDKIRYIKYEVELKTYFYQFSSCNTFWELNEPLFASFGTKGYFISTKKN